MLDKYACKEQCFKNINPLFSFSLHHSHLFFSFLYWYPQLFNTETQNLSVCSDPIDSRCGHSFISAEKVSEKSCFVCQFNMADRRRGAITNYSTIIEFIRNWPRIQNLIDFSWGFCIFSFRPLLAVTVFSFLVKMIHLGSRLLSMEKMNKIFYIVIPQVCQYARTTWCPANFSCVPSHKTFRKRLDGWRVLTKMHIYDVSSYWWLIHFSFPLNHLTKYNRTFSYLQTYFLSIQFCLWHWKVKDSIVCLYFFTHFLFACQYLFVFRESYAVVLHIWSENYNLFYTGTNGTAESMSYMYHCAIYTGYTAHS